MAEVISAAMFRLLKEGMRRAAFPAVRGKLTRFAVIGAVSAGLYSLGTAVSIRSWGFDARWSVVVGYALALPVNFAAHRHHTFRSRGRLPADLLRYAAMQLANIVLCFAGMAVAVNVFGLHYVVGILAGIVVVPVATYLAMDRFVFRHQNFRDCPEAEVTAVERRGEFGSH